MVTMKTTSSITPSNLTDGWHPAYLLHISIEETPGDWAMFEKSPMMYRWHFAAWETPDHLTQEPEVQAGLTSMKFSPKGRYQASKAYTWASQLLGRAIAVGESIDFDTLYPAPCRVKVVKEPGKDFIKVLDVEAWPEGQQHLPAIKEALLSLRATVMAQAPPVIPPVTPQPQAPAPPPAPVQPGMQTWGNVQPQTPASPSAPPKPNW